MCNVNNWTGDATGRLWSFDINADGTLSNMKTVVSGLRGSDGMTMDELGNVYISSGSGVNAYDPRGNKVLSIPAPGGTNNVFAGKNNKLLFMTGPVDRVTSVRMNVSGVEKFK